MVTDSGIEDNSALIPARDSVPVKKEDVVEGSERAHDEILEKAFLGLDAAYKNSYFGKYKELEKALAEELALYWKNQFLLYSAELSKQGHDKIPGPDDEQIYVDIDGTNMHIQQLHSSESAIRLRFYRRKGNVTDIVEMESDRGFIMPLVKQKIYDKQTVKIKTKIENQEFPHASGYALEFSNGNIGSFQRATTIRPVVDGRNQELTRVESVGFYGMHGPTFY